MKVRDDKDKTIIIHFEIMNIGRYADKYPLFCDTNMSDLLILRALRS